jgi:CAAX protease family protein
MEPSHITLPTNESPISFRDSHWSTRWLFTGLAFLFLWRSTALLVPDWVPSVPWWLLLLVTGLIPETFLLLFPILTRCPRGRVYVPKLRRCLIEFGIAIPVVIATIVALAGANYLLGRFSPGTSLEPDAMKQMSESSQPAYMYLMLVFSFTVAPVAEEMFFRGFLHNALRVRMPLPVAIAAQSLIFGFCHFFGALHAAVASVLGLILTLLYQWRKTLIAPIFVHAGINAVAALGVAVMAMDYANSPVLGVIGEPNSSQCVIQQVMPGSAADKSRLRVGDIVISFNGQPIRDFSHLRETVRLYKPGDTIPVSITRDGAAIEINVILQRRGTEQADSRQGLHVNKKSH